MKTWICQNSRLIRTQITCSQVIIDDQIELNLLILRTKLVGIDFQ